jgi:murein DD-endopeptidase MepM/ murein hydrolase activator NlpD
MINTSQGWKGTHVTDNLDLNKGARTAGDIMGKPGTPIGAPEDGTIVRYGSAQGGKSMYFKGVSGKTYWLGHIEHSIPPGTKVKANQPIATISSDHKNPHLHIDATR